MRFVLVLVALPLACAKPHEKPRAPVEAAEAPPVPTPVPAPAPADASTRPVAANRASDAPAAAKTKLVSHMVNGHVEIEEVPIVDEPPPSPVVDAQAAPTPTTTAATTTTTGSAAAPLAPTPAQVTKMIGVARALPDLDKRIALLEQDTKQLEQENAPPSSRAAVFAALGDEYERQNDGAHAVFAYQDAADLAPEYRARLADLQRKNNTERYFTHRETEHFVARFEGEEDADLAHDSLAALDDAYKNIGGKIDLYPREPVTVLFYTGEQYRNTVFAPDWSGGLFDGKIRIPKGARKDVGNVLSHEYTHALLHTLPVAVPAWFNEGLAQWFEEGRIMQPVLDRLKQPGGRKQLPPLTQLRIGFGGLDRRHANVAYACALDLIATLVDLRGEYALRDLVGKMKSGVKFEAAVEDVFGLTQPQLEEHWRERFPE